MDNTPPVTKNLIIINILCFFAAIVAEKYGVDLNDVLGLHYFESDKFRLYQLFTYMFMHSGFEHIFFNMFAVWPEPMTMMRLRSVRLGMHSAPE